MKTIGSIIFICFLFSCSEREKKYYYYQDSRGYVDEQMMGGGDVMKAKKIQKLYQEIRPESIIAFSEKRYSVVGNYYILEGKALVEVIRYYPEDSIAKVIWRPLFNPQVPARLDTRKFKVYVPMQLLHDTLPAVDTVKYIEY